MKKIILGFAFVLGLFNSNNEVAAQCSFTPTVTPNNLMLCPNTQDTLWTQSYDSYQWYKAGQPIPGATNQFLVVDAFMDAGYNFKVSATQAGCTEMSDSVLVDGWAFLPPFAMTDGNFSIGQNGEAIICPGDTVYLVLMPPYTTSIQWYNNGQPIPGANNDTLIVTQSGSYYVEGAPAICPEFIQQLGVSIPVIVRTPIVPAISFSNGMLYAAPGSPALTGFQWFLNGSPITGANAATYTPTVSGTYMVTAVDSGCATQSQPYNHTITGVTDPGFDQQLTIAPNPSTGNVIIRANEAFTVTVYDQLGRVVHMDHNPTSAKQLQLGHLAKGLYMAKLQYEKGIVSRQLVLE